MNLIKVDNTYYNADKILAITAKDDEVNIFFQDNIRLLVKANMQDFLQHLHNVSVPVFQQL